MLQFLSLDDYLEAAKAAKRVAIFREILADRLTPVSIFEALATEMVDGAVLESGMQRQDTGRYSFLAFDPITQYRAKNSNKRCLDELRQLQKDLTCHGSLPMPGLTGGAVGFMTYDAVRLFETIPDRHADEQQLPDIFFNFYRTTLTYDHHQQKVMISMNIEVGDNPQQSYQLAQEKIDALIEKISSPTSHIGPAVKQNIPESIAQPDIDDTEFMHLVERAKKYIIRGDAFQVVLSRRFKQSYTVTPFDIYRAMRRVTPAPYMFYLTINDTIIVGASPEKLISVQEGLVTINPIAGTRRRVDSLNDANIEADLLSDEKEMAEHMMLVDLARNDIGAVCKPGSVTVKELAQVKHFSHVSHITSVVTGQLSSNADAFDALAKAFPAGTLSGAPKIRAMEIIDELETSRRGLYGGTICRLDNQGNLDSCIAIRMAVLKDGVATIRVGGGVVFDSDPAAEAQETRNKARGVLEAVTLAERGLS